MSMKIDINERNELRLREVYSGVLLETQEGNAIGVCMRDDTLEINVIPSGCKDGNWWVVDMAAGTIRKMPAHPLPDVGEMARLREKVAEALGWQYRKYSESDLGNKYWFNPKGHVTSKADLPDPEDIAVVWRLRELAIEKESYLYAMCLKMAALGKEGFGDCDEGDWCFWQASLATKEQIRTAALSVLLGVTVEEVRTWD